MSLQITIPSGGFGFDVKDDIRVCYARGGAISQGDLVCLNISTASDQITGDSLTPTIVPGGVASVFATVTKAYADVDASSGIFAVALEDVRDQGIGRFQFRGLVEKACIIRSDDGGTTNSIRIGQCGVASRASTATLGSASNAGMIEFQFQGVGAQAATSLGLKVIAISRYNAILTGATSTEAHTSTAALRAVLFDGINGFGGLNS